MVKNPFRGSGFRDPVIEIDLLTIPYLHEKIARLDPVYEWFFRMIRIETTKYRCLYGTNPTKIILKYPINAKEKGNLMTVMTDCGELRVEVNPSASALITIK